jgi:hypothetical protein
MYEEKAGRFGFLRLPGFLKWWFKMEEKKSR